MGMALDESTDGLEKLEANGITAYIDPDLHRSIAPRGNIYIDYGTDRYGMSGYSIAIKKSAADKSNCC
jgi:hypothetical protein